MTRFTAIDLARLPPLPRTAATFEVTYAAYMADLTARLAQKGITYDVAMLETDTYAITGEAFSYRTTLVAQSIDDAISAVLLPTSFGAYLDLMGASQSPPVQRNILVPATFGVAAVMEDDASFKARIQEAPEALSTCGPEGAYLFFALNGTGAIAAGVYGPMSFGGTKAVPFVGLGEVRIPIIGEDGDGTASAALVKAVQASVSADERRPIADFVTVSAATVIAYSITATLYTGPGSDPATLLTTAYARVRATADLAHRPGGQMLDQDLYAALKVPDSAGVPLVTRVNLMGWSNVNGVDPTPAMPATAYIAPYCAPIADGGNPVITATDSGYLLVAGSVALNLVIVND